MTLKRTLASLILLSSIFLTAPVNAVVISNWGSQDPEAPATRSDRIASPTHQTSVSQEATARGTSRSATARQADYRFSLFGIGLSTASLSSFISSIGIKSSSNNSGVLNTVADNAPYAYGVNQRTFSSLVPQEDRYKDLGQAVAVPALPEASESESYALLLAGLCMIGMIAYRRFDNR
ncbi:MAG: hypothetical protein JWL63_597 [Rhodocyclales bacterium]|nr:hypothetical protein [Rhodocyclales bacterium]